MEKGGDAAENNLVVTLDNLGRQFWGCCERKILSECCELCEKTVGSERMSCEGQLSANMQVDDEASVNWGASLGEGSV